MAGYAFEGFQWYGPEVMAKAMKSVAAGVTAGAIFLAGKVKQTLSVPAPRVRVLGRRGRVKGVYYYRATTPATSGAPPRKLSGRLRAGQGWETNAIGTEARVGGNVPYGRPLEEGDHPFLLKTAELVKGELGVVIGTHAVKGS